jgi:hypothetical protein
LQRLIAGNAHRLQSVLQALLEYLGDSRHPVT